MRIDILTLFPEMFDGVINSSISKRALENKLFEVYIHDYREFSRKGNKRVDDYSYGGGAGMIIEVQPVVDCLRSIPGYEKAYKVITTAQAKTYNQKKAVELSKINHLIIICGHYEGIDYRIMNYVDEGYQNILRSKSLEKKYDKMMVNECGISIYKVMKEVTSDEAR